MPNIGPVMLDINSTELSDEDIHLIGNKLVGGVILFRRNFESSDQILALNNRIREINQSIIIAVDQEGGRVQRFIEGFSRLPALKQLGEIYLISEKDALEYSHHFGELMALEVQSVGCDISFAPVLDLGYESSQVIGDRAFSTDINVIIKLGEAFINGMAEGGMGATGKHFPGHGSVEADSHFSVPYDDREIEEITIKDLQAFSNLSSSLSAIMPAHIVYSKIDEKPAGFSSIWLQEILRNEIGFDGVIFSDDLSMKGAEGVGNFQQRAKLALDAGCDMILVCNDRHAVKSILEGLNENEQPLISQKRLSRLLMKQPAMGLDSLKLTQRWQFLNEKLISFSQLEH